MASQGFKPRGPPGGGLVNKQLGAARPVFTARRSASPPPPRGPRGPAVPALSGGRGTAGGGLKVLASKSFAPRPTAKATPPPRAPAAGNSGAKITAQGGAVAKTPATGQSLKRKQPEVVAVASPAKAPTGGVASGLTASEAAALKSKNAERFADHLPSAKRSKSDVTASERPKGRFDMTSGFIVDRSKTDANKPKPIVGTCTTLEKSFFRIAGAAQPHETRTRRILEKALLHCKNHYSWSDDYDWACDQLKSIRQDLRVQGIEDKLTVDAYQTHARIALENGDLMEYNQCQTALKDLERGGLAYSKDEFTGYGLLYALYQSMHEEIRAIHAGLPKQAKRGKSVAHALAVVDACRSTNYHRFFRLYLDAPHMGAYILDFMVLRMRKAALERITRAYRSIPVAFLQTELAFDGLKSCEDFLKANRYKVGVVDGEKAMIRD